MPIQTTTAFSLLSKLVRYLGRPLMRALFSESCLAGDVTVALGNLKPVLSVSDRRITAFDVNIGDESVFDVDVMQIDAKVTADGIEVYTSKLTPKPGERGIRSKCSRLFQFEASSISEPASRKLAEVRFGVQVSAIDYLNAILTVTSTEKTWFREFSATRELPIRIRLTN
jgi:hypothetical protein